MYVNAIRHRDQQAKALATLRQQVKEDTTITKDERLEAFNHLRKFKRTTEKKAPDHEREARATLNHFLDRVDKLEKAGGVKRDSLFHKKQEKLSAEMKQFLSKDLSKLKISVETKKAIYSELRPKSRIFMQRLEKANRRSR